MLLWDMGKEEQPEWEMEQTKQMGRPKYAMEHKVEKKPIVEAEFGDPRKRETRQSDEMKNYVCYDYILWPHPRLLRPPRPLVRAGPPC